MIATLLNSSNFLVRFLPIYKSLEFNSISVYEPYFTCALLHLIKLSKWFLKTVEFSREHDVSIVNFWFLCFASIDSNSFFEIWQMKLFLQSISRSVFDCSREIQRNRVDGWERNWIDSTMLITNVISFRFGSSEWLSLIRSRRDFPAWFEVTSRTALLKINIDFNPISIQLNLKKISSDDDPSNQNCPSQWIDDKQW
jgi:hypothetical protein